ncbi:MAG: cation:proton antiporter [Candidatus Kapaibacteriota bacterium]
MHGFEFLDELVLLSLAAVAVILLFQRFKIPPIVGLITAGLIIGPSGLALVAQDDIISVISEIGVILLLFTIGLEFSIDDLKRLRTIVLVGGPLQVLLSTLLLGASAYAVAHWVTPQGISVEGAALIGMAMALSSTAICTKVLKDRRELALPHGRAVMGILIFQDIAVVPLMIITTLLAPGGTLTNTDIAIQLGTMIGVTVFLIVGLRYALPRIIPYVTRTATPEVLILGGLALCFGTAYVTSLAGVSMALGAFIAGLAIGGSEEGHTIGRVLQPMRDAFTSVFFLSIGLLVNISWQWLPMNIITALGILVANAVVVTLVLIPLRVNPRTAVMAAVILAQVGEFSFVLATAGASLGVISDFDLQNLIVSIIITMVVTPLLITFAPWFAERATPVVEQVLPGQSWFDPSSTVVMEDQAPTVTIIGGGVLGANVAQVLKRTTIPYRMLELNPQNVARLRRDGCNVVQGDLSSEEDLERAGIESATVIIVAVSDHTVMAHGVATVRKLRPDAMVMARVRYARDAEEMSRRGADVVITEEYESSIQMFAAVLEHLGVDHQVILEQEDRMRQHRYGALARITPKEFESPSDAS